MKRLVTAVESQLGVDVEITSKVPYKTYFPLHIRSSRIKSHDIGARRSEMPLQTLDPRNGRSKSPMEEKLLHSLIQLLQNAPWSSSLVIQPLFLCCLSKQNSIFIDSLIILLFIIINRVAAFKKSRMTRPSVPLQTAYLFLIKLTNQWGLKDEELSI